MQSLSHIKAHPLHVITGMITVALVSGCVGGNQSVGTVGENGRVYFIADKQEVFSQRLMVGSYVKLSVEPVDVDETSMIQSGNFHVEDTSVAQLMKSDAVGGEMDITGPGQTYLVLRSADGEQIDRIALDASFATRMDFLDPLFLGSQVDARLPSDVAVFAHHKQEVRIQAYDQCGIPLIALNSYDVTPMAPQFMSVEYSESGFYFEGQTTGDFELLVRGRAGPEARLYVHSISEHDVTDLTINLASANPPQANLWGRLFAGTTEVIGVTYDWSAEDNVSLSDHAGPSVIGTVEEEQTSEINISETPTVSTDPAETRTAMVNAGWGNLSQEIDLLTLSYDDLQAQRTSTADEEEDSLSPMGCGDSVEGECDPYAALVLLVGTRVSRRKRGKSNTEKSKLK